MLQDLECAKAANERIPLVVVDVIEFADTSTFGVPKTSEFEMTGESF